MGEVIFNNASSTVVIDGNEMRLSDIEFVILKQLVDAGGRTVNNYDLVKNTWGGEMRCTKGALRQRICKLDKKIGHGHIRNVYGTGYRFEL